MFSTRYNIQESDSVGLGIPTPKDNTISASINPTMGSKASFTNAKNHDKNQVKTANKSAETGEKDNSDDTSELITLGDKKGKNMLSNIIIPLKESTFDDSKLLSKIDSLIYEANEQYLEEFHNTRNENFPTSGAGGQTGNKGTETYMKAGEKATVSGYNQAVSRKMDDEMQRKNSNIDNAARIEPQISARGKTLGITQQATNQNAQTKALGADNNARSQERKDQEMQAAQNG